MTADATTVGTLAHWITKSLTDDAGNPVPLAEATCGAGYLEGVHQTCIALGESATWTKVARRLVETGVLEMRQRRFTSDLQPVAGTATAEGASS